MILCAFVLLTSGIVLGERISSNVQRDMVRSIAFNTALYVSGVVSSQLEKPDGTLQLTPNDLELLDLLFSSHRLGSEIVGIKVWSKDGAVLYATEKELRGQRFPVRGGIEEALAGEVHYEISELNDSENALEKERFQNLLEVYAPMRSQKTREIIGASEIYQRVDQIPHFISASRREVWFLVMGACIVLYVALSGIVKNASDTIQHQNRQLREANRDLEENAVTDFLTKLYNHRYFQERLLEEMEQACRYGMPLSLLFYDLDHFKALNDSYGHQAGDVVLQATAQIIKATTRGSDIAARYGGEEFTVLLVNTDRSDTAAVAERIRSSIEANCVVLPDGREVRTTVSIGVASFPEDAASRDALIERADRAMYAAKKDGRNRVVGVLVVA